ncbi:MAG: MFS transporter [Bdellovibrio sp.]|nr:MAG: MFS transporter [Bdellovibrio sp.]
MRRKKPLLNANSGLIVFVAVLASLLEIIDSSIVNVALPTMMGNLGATLEDISMVITGYAIANAIVLPVSGWLGERVGRRKYYLGCIGAFIITSVACGFAPNLSFLIIFRILQGLAGGALLPTSQALIYEQFPKEKAGIAGALFGMSVMIGPTLGPVMGGYLTDEFGWRSIFNVNVPLGLIAIFFGSLVIFDRQKEAHESKEKPGLDAWGLMLLVLGVGCLQYVLERGESEDWFSSNYIIINSIIAAMALPGFIWWELRARHPIINVRLFKEPIVIYGTLLMTSLGFFLYAVVFILPVFLVRSFHYSATQTGAFFIPGSLLTAAMMPFIGRSLARGMNPKLMILIGLISIEICCFSMTFFSPQSGESQILTSLYIRGFAMAFLFVPINSTILSQFKGVNLGQVSGLLNLSRQIGGSMGIALVATLLQAQGSQNYLDLVPNLSLLDRAAQNQFYSSMQGMARSLPANLGMVTDPMAPALKSILFRVQNQVFMMSFLQLLWIIMALFAVSFLALARLKVRVKPTGPVDSH